MDPQPRVSTAQSQRQKYVGAPEIALTCSKPQKMFVFLNRKPSCGNAKRQIVQNQETDIM
jgi:hypothetical protein